MRQREKTKKFTMVIERQKYQKAQDLNSRSVSQFSAHWALLVGTVLLFSIQENVNNYLFVCES